MSAISQLTRRPRHASLRPVLGGGAAALLVIVIGALILYQVAYRDRIFPGVQVEGLAVGGMTTAEARAALSARLNAAASAPLEVTAAGHAWQLSRAELGAQYDLDGVVTAAYHLGRDGTLLDRLAEPPLLRLKPRDLDVRIDVPPSDSSDQLQPIYDAIDRAPVDARLSVSDDRQVSIQPDQDGTQLDRAEARRRIVAALVAGSTAPVDLPVVAIAPKVRAADLSGARDQARTILSARVVVAYDGQSWELPVATIQDNLILPGRDQAPSSGAAGVKPEAIGAFVDRIGTGLDRSSRDARLVLDGDKMTLHAGQTARVVDRAATVAAIQAALLSDQRTVTAVVKETPPTVVDSDLRSSLDQANQLIGAPIAVQGPGGAAWTLTPAALRKMLVLPDTPAAQRDGPVRLDPAKLGGFVADAAKKVDQPPLNARFIRNGDGSVSLLQDAVAGRKVDQGKAVELIAAAAASSERSVALPILTDTPAFTAADAGQLSSLRLVGDNSTSYSGSIPPRKHNVEFATSLLNGVVVPPGQVFSFNHELGPTTLSRGFQVGYGIEAEGNGDVKTVPSVAGGICQVATTLFQPLFWGGYQIEERYPHAYFIAHYVSHGDPGLDTTVDPDSGLDFRFKNDTTAPMLIQTSTDGTNVHFAIYGVPATWTVKVDPPVISNLIKTDRTPVIQNDATLPKGTQIYTEAAEDGFTVLVRRTVVEPDGNTRVLDLRSVYAPAHNVIAVGTKG